MPESDKRSGRARGGYGYGGGSYGYGYGSGGYGSYGGEAQSRNLRDYLLILRERIWYILVVFAIVFIATVVYTLSRPKIFEASASIRLLREDPLVLPNVRDVMPDDIRGSEDFNTQIQVLNSGQIVQRVAERLRDEDLRQFMKPYEIGGGALGPGEFLAANRSITPVRASLVIRIGFRHPDPQVAAKVANMFVDEYIALNQRQRIEESLRAVEELKQLADQQRKKVEEVEIKLQAYKETHNLVSLDGRRDIATDRLKTLSAQLTQQGTSLKEFEVRRDQIRQFRADGRDLTELSFIASQPIISDLVQRRASQKIALAQLQERYRAKHPRMIEAVSGLDQIERELGRAIEVTASKVESDFEAARKNVEDVRASLAAQEAEILRIDRVNVEYQTLQRDALANEQLHQNILTRMKETQVTSTNETQKARILDRAVPPVEHASPDVPVNLGIGFLFGIGLGLGFAFFIAFIDDRVKSAFDIEAVVGLPLVGIIPQLKRGEMPERATVVTNNLDKQVAEAFRTLHSSIKLNDESKNAQLILITSTIPSEGKSFIASNLALTFAAHGEKTLLVDCDLRKPNVHKEFKVDNNQGLIDHCLGSISLDEAISRNVSDNLDLLTAGGRSKSPTQLLNSKQFDDMLTELRKRYKRVIFDTPPLGAVSDATVILPAMDGSLFIIQFSRAKRKAAQHCARRLLESNVPCFGAVLNGLDIAISGYYYSQYYDKVYKDYYIVSDQEPVNEPAVVKKA